MPGKALKRFGPEATLAAPLITPAQVITTLQVIAAALALLAGPPQDDEPRPRNLILMIADGLGPASVTLAGVARLNFVVNFGALVFEGLGHFGHAFIERLLFVDTQLGGIVAHVLGDLHRTELRSAHGTEMRHLVTLRR